MTHEEGTDRKLLVDVRQEFARWKMMSKPKHPLANHQWVSLIYFLDSEVNLHTMITFLANTPGGRRHTYIHTHTRFHSTGRWFQMFPKRMKGREATHRPALDSTKEFGRGPAGSTRASVLFPPRRPLPDEGPYLWFISPGCVRRVGEDERPDIPYGDMQSLVIKGHTGKE